MSDGDLPQDEEKQLPGARADADGCDEDVEEGEMKPNKENMRKWVEALRSGEYKQGKYQLRRADNTYCCLGVACDLHSKETGTPWSPNDMYVDNGIALPKVVQEWLGIDSADIGLPNQKSLVLLNDVYKQTFAEIADVIEKTFLQEAE